MFYDNRLIGHTIKFKNHEVSLFNSIKSPLHELLEQIKYSKTVDNNV